MASQAGNAYYCAVLAVTAAGQSSPSHTLPTHEFACSVLKACWALPTHLTVMHVNSITSQSPSGHSSFGAPSIQQCTRLCPAYPSADQSCLALPAPAGAYSAGLITEEQRCDIVRNSCPGPGACGGMYTANTMASAIEAMGMTLPYSSSIPAADPLKMDECRMAGRYMLEMMKKDLKPLDIMTYK